ncbi:MAG: amidohydrolase family protein [Rhizomicrobium sp.]
MIRIDAHQHFWRIDRGDYGWLTQDEHPGIARDFLPADLLPLLKAAKIDRTVLVQAAPAKPRRNFLLDLAAATPVVAGVVGWSDFDAPDAASRIARLCANRKLVGLRPMVQDIADDDGCCAPNAPGASTPCSAGTCASTPWSSRATFRPWPSSSSAIRVFPSSSTTAPSPTSPIPASNTWATYIRHIAGSSGTYCKLSGLATQARPRLVGADPQLYVDVLLESFGPRRLMWGSDWPVLNEAGDYAQWLAACETLTRNLSPSDRQAIFGGTAATFYGIA